MSRSDGQPASLLDGAGDVANALLLAPTMEVSDGEGCAHVCSPADLEPGNLLLVSLTTPPDERLASFRSRMGEVAPSRIGFVTAGDSVRSAAATGAELDIDRRAVDHATVSSPGDLTGLGIEVSSFLSEWEDNDDPTVVCFHSLSTLLQYVEVRQVFRFLHVLTGRVEAVGATAHYHLDPGAHDEQDVNTLKPLFDAVVSYDDGEWSVKTR